jgi:hypothetical protein
VGPPRLAAKGGRKTGRRGLEGKKSPSLLGFPYSSPGAGRTFFEATFDGKMPQLAFGEIEPHQIALNIAELPELLLSH